MLRLYLKCRCINRAYREPVSPRIDQLGRCVHAYIYIYIYIYIIYIYIYIYIYIHTSVNSRELQGDLHFADGAIVHAH